VPAWLARIAGGEHLVVMMTDSRAGSNGKAKRELSWRPRHPSWREGFREIVRDEARLAAWGSLHGQPLARSITH